MPSLHLPFIFAGRIVEAESASVYALMSPMAAASSSVPPAGGHDGGVPAAPGREGEVVVAGLMVSSAAL